MTLIGDNTGDANTYIDPSGWAQYSDTALSSGAPQVIPQGATATIQNNALSTITSQIPVGVTSLYDPNTLTITPDTTGDAYLLRVSFTAFTSTNSGLATVLLDIGAPQNIILKRGFTFPKGAGLSNSLDVSMTSLIYSLDTFVNNGGTLKIFSETGDTSIFDVSYVISRTHKGV